jgi:hypothetical protein
MKVLSILLGSVQLAAAIPHDPPAKSAVKPTVNGTQAPPSSPAPETLAPGAKSAPAGCKVLPSDKEWPAKAAWLAKVPSGVSRAQTKDNLKHPDYRVDAKTTEEVVAAVRFAAENNIRLSILNSGHDFLGR